MDYFKEPLSKKIWEIKYRFQKDETIADTWLRVAKTIAKAEKSQTRKTWEKNFYEILEGFQFIPGGRILAGAGTPHHVTLFNCFVMPILEDSLTGIFDAVKEGALTLQQGGGVGYDFSTLRPHGAEVNRAGTVASGPVSFMKIWDAMCGTMLSTGARRGAMMGILRCDHPDIENFIQAKKDPAALRHFNVSVLVTDAFMKAVKENQEWSLVFAGKIHKKVNARVLWNSILKSAYDYAEPGVLFYDTINRFNNLWYAENISATNPCGEIPLPDYGACDLGAINLTQLIQNPFSKDAAFDWNKLEKITQVATRFLDNVITVSRYPLKKQKEKAHQTRRIGLGLTGLGDALVMLNLRYGSQASLELAGKIMRCIALTTWQTSIELAREKGIFPLYDAEKYLAGQFVQSLPNEIKNNIEKFGVRNSHHNTIAPTGTTSLLANNISNGIEPIFTGEYERFVRLGEDDQTKFLVKDYAKRLWDENFSENNLPPAWVDTTTLLPEDHLNMQFALQPFIDNAISKTINLPENFPFEKLNDVYTKAHEFGLKGCTIFRPNPVTGSVLQAVKSSGDSVDRCCNQ